MNKTEAQKRIDTIKQDLKAIGQELKSLEDIIDQPEKKGRWNPEYDENYFYIHDSGSAVFVDCIYSADDQADKFRISQGNCFKTREQAERVLKAKQKIAEIIGDWEPDWENTDMARYYNYFNNLQKIWEVGLSTSGQSLGDYYYPSKEKAIEAQQWEEVIRTNGEVNG